MIILITGLIALIFIFMISVFDFSLKASNLYKIELDERKGERYTSTINLFLKERGRYALATSISKSVWGVIFIVAGIFYAHASILSVILVLTIYVLFSEVAPRVFSLIIPGFFAKNMHLPVRINYNVFISIAGLFWNKTEIKEKTVNDYPESEEEEEMEFLKNALDLPDIKLKECLIPRTEICAVPKEITREELIGKFMESGYSRIPVFDGSIDKIVGYYHIRDLLLRSHNEGVPEIRSMEIYPETMNAKDLLTTMKRKKASICIVSDEYGGTAGMVTLEDLIEEIFGDISDEQDNNEFQEKRVGEKGFIFSGRIEIRYLNREYGLNFPERDEYETLGGFIMYINENISKEGDTFTTENYRLKVLRIRRNSIATVFVGILD